MGLRFSFCGRLWRHILPCPGLRGERSANSLIIGGYTGSTVTPGVRALGVLLSKRPSIEAEKCVGRQRCFPVKLKANASGSWVGR